MSKVKLFIEHAEVLRNGGIVFAVGPHSYGLSKIRYHYNERMESAFAAILRFNRKHPDSTRTIKAKHMARSLRQARFAKGAVYAH